MSQEGVHCRCIWDKQAAIPFQKLDQQSVGVRLELVGTSLQKVLLCWRRTSLQKRIAVEENFSQENVPREGRQDTPSLTFITQHEGHVAVLIYTWVDL